MESHELLPLVLTQVWQVGLLAVFVWALTRAFAKNQPQIAHLLWGLVLIKVITPPIWSSPTSVFGWIGCGPHPQYHSLMEMPDSSPSRRTIAAHLAIDVAVPKQAPGIKLEFTENDQVRDAASSRQSPTASTIVGRDRVAEAILVAWLSGVCFLLVASAMRVVSFWWWVRSTIRRGTNLNHERCLQLELQVQELTDATAIQLGLRRQVRVRLLNAPIGPAVVGLFRPAIVLPIAIVENRTSEFLQPLIAHELVHIRRGDLFWAALQSLSTSWLWFHPFVWLAARKLTSECERSCDEQTIAWLGCSPKTYAQSLIDVLERKNQLRVAPALPGVRPVDITKLRLERIMNLGHGSRKYTPIWAWTIFAAAGAMVLPGSMFVGAQEINSFSGPPTPPLPTANTSQAQQGTISQPATAEFEVGGLLEKLQAGGKTDEQARASLLAFLPHGVLQPVFRGDHDGTVSQTENARIAGTRLHVVGTREQVSQVREALEERRRFGFDQIGLKVHFLTVSKKRMDELAIPWRKAENLTQDQFNAREFDDETLSSTHSIAASKIAHSGRTPRQDVYYFENGSTVVQPEPLATQPTQLQSDTRVATQQLPPTLPRPLQRYYQPDVSNTTVPSTLNPPISFELPKSTELRVPALQTPAFYAILTEADFRPILNQAQSSTRTSILQAPLVTALNGMHIHISDTVQRPFVTGITPIHRESATTDIPTIQIAAEGTKLVTQPNIADNGNIDLLLALNDRRIQQVDTFTYDKAVTEDSQGNRRETGKTVQIPQLASRYFALKSSLRSGESLLVTSGIPTLNALGEGTDEVLIAVATINEIRNVAQQPTHEGQTVDPSATPRHDKAMPSPNLKTGSRLSKPEQLREQQAHERDERVPILGPVTSGGSAVALAPPSDDQILHAIQKRSRYAQSHGRDLDTVTMVKQKIADYVDPPQFVPLIGNAILHHAHYKCSVYVTEPTTGNKANPHGEQGKKVAIDVIFIDHTHYHLVSSP